MNKTKNNIGRILHRNVDINRGRKYLSSVVYQLRCHDCPLVYNGQEGRKIPSQVQRHALAYKFNDSRSAYAQHVTTHGHSLGHMEDVMDIIFTAHKGRYLDRSKDTIYIKKTNKGVQINDKSAITKNKILRVTVKMTPNRWHDSDYKLSPPRKPSVRRKLRCEQVK